MDAVKIADAVIAKGGQLLLPVNAGDCQITYSSRSSLRRLIIEEIEKEAVQKTESEIDWL
jgi:hypothetical protein